MPYIDGQWISIPMMDVREELTKANSRIAELERELRRVRELVGGPQPHWDNVDYKEWKKLLKSAGR